MSTQLTELQRFRAMWKQWECEGVSRTAGTISAYARYLNGFIVWLHSQQKHTINDVTTTTIAAYFEAMQYHLAVSTLRGTRAALRVWTDWLFSQGYLPQQIDWSQV